MPFTQAGRIIKLDTPLGEDVLLLQSFTGQEGVSQVFRFDLELLSEANPAIAAEDILGQRATITVALPGYQERYVNGFISAFEQTGQDPRFTYYRAQLVPWLWLLGRTAGCRIFQRKTIPQIIAQVFEDLGFRDFRDATEGSYAPRDYCVQYRETALNFVARLMEQYGIFYFFEHEQDRHTLVLADSTSACQDCPRQARVRFAQVVGELEEEDHISDWSVRHELRPGKYSLTDYNFETPAADLATSVSSAVGASASEVLEIYDYPGEYLNRSSGEELTRIRMEEEEAAYAVARGVSNCRGFLSGFKFTLAEHYRRDWNAAWMLTAVTHSASVGESYHGRQPGEGENYSNFFTAIPATVPFRPPRITPRPVVQGPQTAVVVGKQGEEIWVDQYGRVKVQFHWDRESQANEDSSCWIRVSQLWAGKHWGAMWIPRIGQEVIVDFLEGDPDQPIITGRVYNAVEMPPYDLPAEQTKSAIKSHSSKGGGGFNEIRFEDKKGAEQVFLHGEKDLEVRIKNDRKEWIGRDRHLIVTRDKFEKIERDTHRDLARDHIEKIGRDHHLEIAGKEAIKIVGSHSLKVQGDVIEEFAGNQSTQVTQNIYVKGRQVVIEAATGITLKVGGNFITIDLSGVAVKGNMIQLNSAGTALSGSPGALVSPLSPTAAKEAVKAKPGEVTAAVAAATRTPMARPSPASDAPTHNPNAPENKEKKHWIEIELVDEAGQPVPGEAYRITLPDGATVADGTLDEKGLARVDHIDPGSCRVTFPRLDGDAWRPK